MCLGRWALADSAASDAYGRTTDPAVIGPMARCVQPVGRRRFGEFALTRPPPSGSKRKGREAGRGKGDRGPARCFGLYRSGGPQSDGRRQRSSITRVVLPTCCCGWGCMPPGVSFSPSAFPPSPLRLPLNRSCSRPPFWLSFSPSSPDFLGYSLIDRGVRLRSGCPDFDSRHEVARWIVPLFGTELPWPWL